MLPGLDLFGVLLDLGLLLLIIYQFQLVSRSFFHVTLLASVGFAINARLPLRFRLHFFATLSVASLAVAFGFVNGAWLLVLGGGLLAICHLPITFPSKVVALLLAGLVLAALRAGVLAVPWSPSIWPILGSMFMFRLALYMHALRHEKVQPTLARGLGYFFMLPNVCFPLFPVVDYATFTRTHYEGDAAATYRTGISWMLRGLVHLILYRLVYLHLVVDPSDIADLGTLAQHILSTFLLYLRVSGEFHLVVGMLYLYGFRLPETHRLYYLASSFTDFWRRINIYWKDFMMKLVYYPSFFQMRRYGATRALVFSTIIVFLATWLLHSYQWFWLRGDFPVTVEDGLFWVILGGLVVVNAVREARRGRDRLRGRSRWSGALAVRTVATFLVLCVLWSLWSAESASQWLWLWTAAARFDAADVLVIGLFLAAGLAIAGRNWNAPSLGGANRVASIMPPVLRTRVALAALVLAGTPQLVEPISSRGAALIASVQEPRMNERDRVLEHRGYYERMDNVARLSSQVWQTVATRPDDWVPLTETAAWRVRDDFLRADLAPSTRITFYQAPLQVNAWGMRDREITLEKAPGVYRIALLGPSFIMGAGVGDDGTIDHFLEERLHRESGDSIRFEVLNFGINNYSLTQQVVMLEERVMPFAPDVVVVADNATMHRRAVSHMLAVLYAGLPLPDPELTALIEATGAHQLGHQGRPIPFEIGRRLARRFELPARMPWNEAHARLRLVGDDLVGWSMRRLAATARQGGATPVFALMDIVGEGDMRAVPAMKVAGNAGFTVLDIRDAYAGHDLKSLQVAEWDRHPNEAGTRVLADRLFAELARRDMLPLAARPASGSETHTALED